MARDIEIFEAPVASLVDYGSIPIAFQVRRKFDVELISDGLGGVAFHEREVGQSFVKDYDAMEGNSPHLWAAQWDVSNWAVLSACRDGIRAGGAVVAFDTVGVDMLEGRRDLVVLWDIRVHPDYRREGVGRALFTAVEALARARGCLEFKVETQNTNVEACRFYVRQGCSLAAFNRFAYRDCPEEIQLIWQKSLHSLPT